MTRPKAGAAIGPALPGILLAAVAACGARAGEIAPARVALTVRWGGARGPEAFREAFQRALAADLATGCFAAVAIEGEPPGRQDADLDLEVVLSEPIEETRFDDSIAGTLQPGTPDQELRRVARSSVTIDATLAVRRVGTIVRRKRFAASASRRPEFIGEDPQAGARGEAIENGVRALARQMGCGSAKLARRIREARAAAEPSAPRPR